MGFLKAHCFPRITRSVTDLLMWEMVTKPKDVQLVEYQDYVLTDTVFNV